MLASPLFTHRRERSKCSPITDVSLELRHVHHPSLPVRGDPCGCAHTRASEVEIQMCCRSLISDKERIFSEHREIRDFLQLRVDHDAQGAKLLYQDSLRQNIIRDCFLRNKRFTILSEARSGLNMQELRVESADRALHEASLQLHSQRMECFQRNQLSHHSRREKERLCTQLEERERTLQDTSN